MGQQQIFSIVTGLAGLGVFWIIILIATGKHLWALAIGEDGRPSTSDRYSLGPNTRETPNISRLSCVYTLSPNLQNMWNHRDSFMITDPSQRELNLWRPTEAALHTQQAPQSLRLQCT